MARKDGYYWVQRPGQIAMLGSYWSGGGSHCWWVAGEANRATEAEFEQISDELIEPPAGFRKEDET